MANICQWTTGCYVPGILNLHQHHCDILRSCSVIGLFGLWNFCFSHKGYLMALSISHGKLTSMLGQMGNDEFEMFWEALVVAYVRCYPIICSKREETEEIHETHQLQYLVSEMRFKPGSFSLLHEGLAVVSKMYGSLYQVKIFC